MSTSPSQLVDNLSEGLHNNRCADCKSSLDYMITKDENYFLVALPVKRIMKRTLIKN